MPPIDTGRLVDLVRTIDFCITPDTGIAHLAGMLGVRTLVFYAAQRFEPVVWKPDFDHVEINVPPRYRPLPTIPLDELIGAIDDFLKKRLFA
jgi:ADP-heptose:LPS heptosyltransferase